MKKAILLWGVLMLLTFGLIVQYQARAGEPKVLIPESKWDFGLIPASSVVSHYYLIKNMGTDTLKIENVKPG